MPSIFDILQQLQSQAQPRQDLGGAPGARPYTFAGRVGNANQPTSVTKMLTRTPQESPDAEGLGAAATLAGMGVPLSKLMQLKPGTDLNQILEEMYQGYKKASPNMSRDQWMKMNLNNLAMSAYRDPEVTAYAKQGMLNSGAGMGPFNARPSLSDAIGQYHYRTQNDIPRMHQLAATLNMADKSGLLNAENLAKATAEQGKQFSATPNQSILDQLSNYLEQIRPERK